MGKRDGKCRGAGGGFDAWLAHHEPRLRQALVAAFGAVDGREACVDAFSWAWEHWSEVQEMSHPLGYLFRVGQSARRRFAVRPIPGLGHQPVAQEPTVEVELWEAVAGLPVQQRTVVLLVEGFQWRQQEVADLLDVSPSTVHAHLRRGLDRLEQELRDHG